MKRKSTNAIGRAMYPSGGLMAEAEDDFAHGGF